MMKEDDARIAARCDAIQPANFSQHTQLLPGEPSTNGPIPGSQRQYPNPANAGQYCVRMLHQVKRMLRGARLREAIRVDLRH